MAADDIAVRDIAAMLNSHAEALGFLIFPAARKGGGFLSIGSLQGEPGQSLKIRISGPKRGTWADYSASPNEPNGKGDMLKLLKLTLAGGDMKRAVEEAKKYLNLDTMDPGALDRQRQRANRARERAEQQRASDDERRRGQAQGMWTHASILTPSSPPVKYLAARGIDFALLGKLPGAIRYRVMRHADTGRDVPAMLTKGCDLHGRHVFTHVTYLDFGADGWRKLPCPAGEKWAKKIFGPMTLGAHIPLWKGRHPGKLADLPAGVPIECSEGIEDGLSFAMANRGSRVIAGATLGNIGMLRLPPQAGDFNILAQNDTKPQPIEALEKAVKAQQAQAAAQGSSRAICRRYPPQGIKDWNDWLMAGNEGGE